METPRYFVLSVPEDEQGAARGEERAAGEQVGPRSEEGVLVAADLRKAWA